MDSVSGEVRSWACSDLRGSPQSGLWSSLISGSYKAKDWDEKRSRACGQRLVGVAVWGIVSLQGPRRLQGRLGAKKAPGFIFAFALSLPKVEQIH